MALITVHHHTRGALRLTTRTGRWLDDIRATARHWLIKQNDGTVTNVWRAVVDDFGNLVPTQQMDGARFHGAPWAGAILA